MHDHDHEHATGHGERRGLTRRQLLLGGLGAGALGLLLPELGVITDPLGLTTANAQTTPRNRYRLAMHVHSSFSEGVGSMYAALAEARPHQPRPGVLHRARPSQEGHQTRGAACTSRARRSSRTPAAPGTGSAGPRATPPARTQQWVTSPSSPVEPGHALRLTVTAPGAAATAMNGFDGDDGVVGQVRPGATSPTNGSSSTSASTSPRPTPGSSSGCTSPYYPALAGYPQGLPDRSPTASAPSTGRSRDAANPLRGIVSHAGAERDLDDGRAPPGRRHRGDLHRAARCRPTTPPRRPRPHENIVMTVGGGGPQRGDAAGWFDRLRFFHDSAGPGHLRPATADARTQYGPLFPTVHGQLGDEISRNDPHLQWLTGAPTPISYDLNSWPAQRRGPPKAIDAVHAARRRCSSTTIPSAPKRRGSFTDQTAPAHPGPEPAEERAGPGPCSTCSRPATRSGGRARTWPRSRPTCACSTSGPGRPLRDGHRCHRRPRGARQLLEQPHQPLRDRDLGVVARRRRRARRAASGQAWCVEVRAERHGRPPRPHRRR